MVMKAPPAAHSQFLLIQLRGLILRPCRTKTGFTLVTATIRSSTGSTGTHCQAPGKGGAETAGSVAPGGGGSRGGRAVPSGGQQRVGFELEPAQVDQAQTGAHHNQHLVVPPHVPQAHGEGPSQPQTAIPMEQHSCHGNGNTAKGLWTAVASNATSESFPSKETTTVQSKEAERQIHFKMKPRCPAGPEPQAVLRARPRPPRVQSGCGCVKESCCQLRGWILEFRF